MVDSEFVAVGAETHARLTDLGVMPKPGGEGEQAKPDYRRQGPMRHDCHDGFHEDLANRIRELIASEDGYTEQKMFGGIGFMIDGHMAVGVSGEGGLMIHCSKEETLRVDAESVSTKRELEPWVMESVAFARALPPKKK
jgi:hypothetical protein